MTDDQYAEVQSWIESLSDQDPEQRTMAAERLGLLISKNATTKEQKNTILRLLSVKADDEMDGSVASAAVYALGKFMCSGEATKNEKNHIHNKMTGYIDCLDDHAPARLAAADVLADFMFSDYARQIQKDRIVHTFVSHMPDVNKHVRHVIAQSFDTYLLTTINNPDKQKNLLELFDKQALLIDKEASPENNVKQNWLSLFAQEVELICRDTIAMSYHGTALSISQPTGVEDNVVIIDPPSRPDHDHAIAAKKGKSAMIKGASGMMQYWLDYGRPEPDYWHFLRFMKDVVNPPSPDAPVSQLVL
jgi:hypothetical protein